MKRRSRWLTVALLLPCLAPLLWGVWSYQLAEAALAERADASLRSTARLTALTLAEWRSERLAEGTLVASSITSDVADESSVRARLAGLQQRFRYLDVALVAADGRIRVSAGGAAGPLADELVVILATALRERQPLLADQRPPAGRPELPLHIIVPIEGGDAGLPTSALILTLDASPRLAPLLQRLATPDAGSRVVIVRHDEQAPAPAATDAAGRPMPSATAPVPGAPWRVEALGDPAALVPDWRPYASLGSALGVGWLALTGLALAILRQRDTHEAALLQSLATLRESEERYRTTLMSIGDGVIATDALGRVELLDPVAEQLTGWPQAEARGRPIEEIFRIVDETTRAPVEAPALRAMREGITVAMDNHTLLIARDGTERPIADSGAPIRTERGEITGAVLVFRDQSAERAAQEALRQSEEKLSSMLNTMEEVIWSVRLPEYAMLYMTPSAERLYGIPYDDFMADSRHWERAVHPDDVAVIPRIYAQLATAGEYAEEYRIIHADGTVKWVSNRGKVIVDADGTPSRIDGIVADITSRKLATLELEHTRDLLSQTSRIARIGGWELDLPALQLRWSEVTYEIHEVEADYVPDVARALDFYRAGFSREAIRAAVEGCITTGTPFDLELELVTAGGRELWVRAIGQPVVDGARCVKIWGVLQDITAQRRAEQELRIKEAAIAAAPLGIVVCDARDPELPVVYANPAEERISGYPREELLGRNLRFFQGTDRDQPGLEVLRQALAAGRACQVELRNYSKEGRRYIIELNIAPVTDASGALTHFVGIQRDITRQLTLQAQLVTAQKLDAVGRLAGGVAHDFNNGLQAILGYTELALTVAPPEAPLMSFLHEIRGAAERAAALTRQLLGYARGQLVEPRAIHINAALEGTLAMLRRLVREDIAIAWRPGPEVEQILIDPSHLDQIVINLTLNARDAITGAGTITIATEQVVLTGADESAAGAPQGSFVLLTVQDDGSGMDAATQAQLFEPFFTTKPIGQGTGLGLATVHAIVVQNGGLIRIASQLGAGTVVRVYLPVAPAAQPASAHMVAPEPRLLPRGSETVLLAEDDPSIRDLGARILRRLGYTVLSASTPNEALRLAATYPATIDLLLADVIMPEMHGRELVRRIVALRPGTRWLLMSGHAADVISEREAPEQLRFIQKPFVIGELAARVRAALEGDQRNEQEAHGPA